MVQIVLNTREARTAFDDVERVDLSIDCAFEGSAGAVWADQPGESQVFMIEVGPFRYLAGNAACPAARDAVKRLAPGDIVMPSAEGWFDLVKSTLGDRIEEAPRWSFPSTGLDKAISAGVVRGSKDAARIVRIDESSQSSTMLATMPLDLSGYRGAVDFVKRGVGFLLPRNGKAIGIACSSLSCNAGIEVSVYIKPGFRRQGYGTLLAARLVDWCLQQGVPPHWDAANYESCQLARKLGYPEGKEYISLMIAGEKAEPAT